MEAPPPDATLEAGLVAVHPADPALVQQAEEVRAFLVQVRGGAPFLSSTDGRALVGWLEAGVPVTRILRAIEATAVHRRAKRLRSPFTLVGCARALAKGTAARLPPPAAPADPELDATLAAIAAVDLADPEERARARCAIARGFHELLWERADRAALLAEAALALADFADTLAPTTFAGLCEEWAREGLRRQYPMLSATRIWEECSFGVE